MWNDSKGRYEYTYNEKGLLIAIEEYNDNKLRDTILYKYDYIHLLYLQILEIKLDFKNTLYYTPKTLQKLP